MRHLTAILLAGALHGHAQQVLFNDTFDRADSRNIDASLTGVTDGTGGSLAADAFYVHGHVDPNNAPPAYGEQDGAAADGGGARILGNQLQLAVGAGTSNAFVDHNFTDPAIITAGGFSVSVDVTGYSGIGYQQGGAIAIGMSAADAASTSDSFVIDPGMVGAFNDASVIGQSVPGTVVSDFWIALRGNNSLAWGGSSGLISGVTGPPAKTGTIRVDFAISDFNAGSLVKYEVFYNNTTQGTGEFTWSGTAENFIGLDARDGSSVGFDNFDVRTWQPPPAVTLDVSPETIDGGDTAAPVTLSWHAQGLPPGATYEITADQPVVFPNGGLTGTASNGNDSVDALVDGTLGDTIFTIEISDTTPAVIAADTAVVIPPAPPSPRPNVVVILVDDLGWSDLGSYGSEIPTPNIDSLASNGVRFRQFYNSARCSPTRCSILTGLYPQQAAVNPAASLPNLRDDNNVTFAELLGADGYRTYMAGKWHLGGGGFLPENRGFQHVWRFANPNESFANMWNQGDYTLASEGNEIQFLDYGGSFYQTDAIGDYAVDFIDHTQAKGDGAPFAMYLAFGAPHFPIQAPADLADIFMPTYAQGWDVIRRDRYDRQLATGVIDDRYPFPGLGGTGPHQQEPVIPIPAWDTLPADRQADLTRRMALYAAMITKVDDAVGKLVTKLEQVGRLDNTMILFVSDNGANGERGVFGSYLGSADQGPMTGTALTNMGQPGQGDNIHYGGGWAHASNTPLKLFKHFTHEGGIRAPAIVHWPDGFSARGSWVETPAHLIDVMGTIVDITDAPYPEEFEGRGVLPLEGTSLVSLIDGAAPDRTLFVEHETNRMALKGKWKLVTESFTAFDNEFTAHQKLLYDIDADPAETTDLAAEQPGKVVELVDEWNAWSTRVGLPASHLIQPPPANVTPAATATDLFLDTFNRPANADIDASNAGMSGGLVPPLGGGVTWFEGFEGSGPGSMQIVDGVLQMATGTGMSENGLNHNFIGTGITDAGGFSVSLRIIGINSELTELDNRYAGFGVGLNAAQAAGGNDIGDATPPSIRGRIDNPGTADCFLDLDLNGDVKLWLDGLPAATVPVGKTTGTLTAAFACDSFAAGATVTVSAWLDGTRLDLDPGGASMDRTFTWDEADSNHIALSARASASVQVDNFAVRELPLATAFAVEYALAAGLDADGSAPDANPDGDRLDNFGEWAFGTAPDRPDDEVSATSLVLVEPSSGIFRFAHRRLAGHATAGLRYVYRTSNDLSAWSEITPVEESSATLPATDGYEVVTLRLGDEEMTDGERLFLQIAAEAPY